MTRINGLDVPEDQIPRLTAELHKQAVEGPSQRVSRQVADRLSAGGDIDLTGEDALATIEAITAAGLNDDALLARLRDNLGEVTRWKILDGPNKQTEESGIDGELWLATIESVNDPAQKRIVGVEIPRSILQSDLSKLDDAIRRAVESNGRTAIDRYLEDSEPPDRIVVGHTAILPEPQ
jgi:hypothetical protein